MREDVKSEDANCDDAQEDGAGRPTSCWRQMAGNDKSAVYIPRLIRGRSEIPSALSFSFDSRIAHCPVENEKETDVTESYTTTAVAKPKPEREESPPPPLSARCDPYLRGVSRGSQGDCETAQDGCIPAPYASRASLRGAESP